MCVSVCVGVGVGVGVGASMRMRSCEVEQSPEPLDLANDDGMANRQLPPPTHPGHQAGQLHPMESCG
jgi:hypothetical protein